MTKKDFIALADVLKDLNPSLCLSGHGPIVEDGRLVQWSDTIDAMCRFCKSQNSAFKEERFRAYIAGECGPNGGTIK